MSRSNFFYKTIFSFIFFLPCIVFSQSILTYNKDNFLEQLNKDFNVLGIQLTEKEILNDVFGHINTKGGELVINELDLNNIKGEVIRQFEDYMKTYISEMHKMFV